MLPALLGVLWALGLGGLTPPPAWAQDNAAGTAPAAAKLDGIVLGANDKPLANAWVSVLSAGPRDGQPGTIPIKHYPECGRYTRTDAQGHFAFSGLNPNLLYRLLVAAPGHRTDYIRDADPQYGGTQVKLRRMAITNATPSQIITGRVIDPQGRPVPGARVEVNGYRAADTSYSSNTRSLASRVDSPTVTDENGGFTLACASSVEALSVSVDGPRLARRRLWLTPGEAHLIRLNTGVTVTGRVLDGTKPVGGTTITLETDDQSSATFMRGFDVATDAEGRFKLTHVPAGTAFKLSTPTKEQEALNAGVAITPVTTGSLNGSTTDVGDIQMIPAYLLRGRVVLSDGQVVPEKTRIYLGFGNSGTQRNAALDADGWFEFAGIRSGPINLSIRIPGYRISARNPSKDWLNEGRLVGQLKENHEQFFIELEPGNTSDTSKRPANADDRQPFEKPLRPAKIDG